MEKAKWSFRGLVLLACIGVLSPVDGKMVMGQRRTSPRKPPPASKTKPPTRASQEREPELQFERLPPDPQVEEADIAITANVKARSLVFETVPTPTVEFPGKPARNTVWEAVRENLPTPVEPGVTYRNIGIRLKITSVFRDIDRIVAEALGEVPVSENAKPDQPKSLSATSKTTKTDSSSSSHPPHRQR